MEEYRNLAYAVLRTAVYDYYDRIRQGVKDDFAERQLDIDDVWFFMCDINKEWFMEKVHKRGEEIWQQKFGKKTT